MTGRNVDGWVIAVSRNRSKKINRHGHERVHLWAGTQVVVVTGRSLWLDEREA